jgi:hypothetical protein
MGQGIRNRRQRVVAYSANNQVTEELSRSMLYRELFLTLTAQPTVAGAANTAANTEKGGLWGVIRNLELVLNGADVVFRWDGAALLQHQRIWYGNINGSAAGDPTPLLGDGATANPSLVHTLILPFWLPNAIKPIDTMLDSRDLSNFDVRVTWGDHTDINSAATGFTTAPQLTVSSYESFGLPRGVPLIQWRRNVIQQSITSTTADFRIDLPVNFAYRGFVLNLQEAGVDATAALPILNNLQLKSGTTVFADLERRVLFESYRQRMQLQPGYNIGPDNDEAAWVIFDNAVDGRFSESIDTFGFSEFFLNLDVTAGAASTIRVYPMQFVLPRKVGAGA